MDWLAGEQASARIYALLQAHFQMLLYLSADCYKN